MTNMFSSFCWIPDSGFDKGNQETEAGLKYEEKVSRFVRRVAQQVHE